MPKSVHPVNQNQYLGDILDSFSSVSLRPIGLNAKGEITYVFKTKEIQCKELLTRVIEELKS